MTIDNTLEEMTLRQLRRVASVCGVSRYSRMRKSQLLEEIQKAQNNKNNSPSTQLEAQLAVEAGKFELGVDVDLTAEELAAVDEGLGELPGGYGDSYTGGLRKRKAVPFPSAVQIMIEKALGYNRGLLFDYLCTVRSDLFHILPAAALTGFV